MYLYALLLLLKKNRVLVFANAISSVRRITPMLVNLGLPALPVHSEMAQKARLQSIEKYTAADKAVSSAGGSILVATDVAARGLDIPAVDVVIHYHVPNTADAYVHRSGRTARAERTGLSILLCAPDEVLPTRRLVAKVHEGSGSALARSGDKASTSAFLNTIDFDRRILPQLRERLHMAKTLADAAQAKVKQKHDTDWLQKQADALDIPLEEAAERVLPKGEPGKLKKQEMQLQGMTKAQMRAMGFELKQLLAKPINTGVSERYLTAGGAAVYKQLGDATEVFLGKVETLGLGKWVS